MYDAIKSGLCDEDNCTRSWSLHVRSEGPVGLPCKYVVALFQWELTCTAHKQVFPVIRLYPVLDVEFGTGSCVIDFTYRGLYQICIFLYI